MKKLKLNKEKIAQLSREQSSSVVGGGTGGDSTKHNFTCCWCTSDNYTGDGAISCNCSVPEDGTTCPPGY